MACKTKEERLTKKILRNVGCCKRIPKGKGTSSGTTSRAVLEVQEALRLGRKRQELKTGSPGHELVPGGKGSPQGYRSEAACVCVCVGMR